ncbi:MAG: hypothetical protein LBH50_01690 [Spirochaetaceae bacterium]|jgi:hypothetical protein|nr:hypothetical protein [Spirochaetaceae bacterium]
MSNKQRVIALPIEGRRVVLGVRPLDGRNFEPAGKAIQRRDSLVWIASVLSANYRRQVAAGSVNILLSRMADRQFRFAALYNPLRGSIFHGRREMNAVSLWGRRYQD